MADIISKHTDGRALKCLIVDDEPIAIEGIVNYINRMDFLEVEDSCSSAIEAAEILKKKEIDLMFLDINMPYLSGLEFLESLEKAPMTILTTAYSEYALEGFRLHVVDYLLKPITFQRFFQAASKAQKLFQSQILLQNNGEDAKSNMYIRQGDSFDRIAWQDILYVEGMQNYLKLHFKDKTLVIHQTMTSLEEILPKDTFFRIHRSFLLNISYIDSISGGRIFVNGKELPISKQRKEELLNTVVYKNLLSK
ncbi:LytR/AlgR family response regulator transcription factor [Dysgonomonas sp. GY617]|uniref:LytR/AlgR family response regulator transcription factor n=1 Tax=Dysgonomonas sp. GY617 TaxID=2780420 RepID=UPI0018831974|nr:LytTR family DNA-binding domain-containing protein [Dysgonomonas sp. GY617]MBF0575145.1 response regulator transcription factor [Dysgonomonas sp. GY617]